jgi:putative endopeptidase
MMRPILLSLLLAATAAAQQPLKSGVDTDALDRSCKPCDDFWRFANGGWVDKNPIPARYSNWGTFTVLQEANRERLRVILEQAAASRANAASPDQKRIGDFFASCMDTAAIDAAGIKPIASVMARINALKSPSEVQALLVELQRDNPIGPFGVFGSPDLKNSKEVIASVGAGGLSLPDRDYYFKDDARTKKIREEMLKHITATFTLLGDNAQQAEAAAKTVFDFESTLANATMTNVQRRDPYARYHKMDLEGLSAMAPAVDWKALFKQFGIAPTTPVNVSEPEFIKTVQTQLTSAPVDTWKTWIRWRVASSASPFLSKPFRDESFRFRTTVLSGATEQQPRWQQCANTVDGMLGDSLGRLFVEKHFPPEAKKRMNALVENLRGTLRDELSNAAWLAPETRKNAVAKLNAFVAKIGYPDRWRDYSAMKIDGSLFFQNVRSAALFARNYQMAKIGKPVDRNDWGMTPPTVNAYYSPLMNEIAFPAGILQAPFFDLEADDAANYGAIGVVIGHEMGHGFDDQGSKFDAEGNLRNWWTPEDRKKFDERAACVIDQFNTLDVGEGLRHNGKLVVGEAFGDIGGLALSYKAYQRSLGGKPGPVLDGFTADQRFFLAFARVWARSHRPEDLRLRLNTDPHPIAKFRTIGTLQNSPEFHRAFNCKLGDPMVRPPEKQCMLW